MKSETQDKLQGIFDKYRAKQAEILKVQEKLRSEREIFLQGFEKKIKEIIRPIFKEIGESLKSQGQGYEVTHRREAFDSHGNIMSARIQLEIFPDGQRAQPGERPFISFIANSVQKEIWTYVSTMMPGHGGCAGQRNAYSLDEVTPEAVEEEVLYLVANCFG